MCSGSRRPTTTLFLVAACVVATVLLSPRTYSSITSAETDATLAALALVTLVNVYLLRQVVTPAPVWAPTED